MANFGFMPIVPGYPPITTSINSGSDRPRPVGQRLPENAHSMLSKEYLMTQEQKGELFLFPFPFYTSIICGRYGDWWNKSDLSSGRISSSCPKRPRCTQRSSRSSFKTRNQQFQPACGGIHVFFPNAKLDVGAKLNQRRTDGHYAPHRDTARGLIPSSIPRRNRRSDSRHSRSAGAHFVGLYAARWVHFVSAPNRIGTRSDHQLGVPSAGRWDCAPWLAITGAFALWSFNQGWEIAVFVNLRRRFALLDLVLVGGLDYVFGILASPQSCLGGRFGLFSLERQCFDVLCLDNIIKF